AAGGECQAATATARQLRRPPAGRAAAAGHDAAVGAVAAAAAGAAADWTTGVALVAVCRRRRAVAAAGLPRAPSARARAASATPLTPRLLFRFCNTLHVQLVR
ncbi:MAG: hypothetical protein MHM6MM_000973, partial [Cercozoa sp. M6MM]